MNTLEIKGSLFDLLWSVEDPQTLLKVRKVVLELLGKAQKEEADWWEELSPQQQLRLDKAMADAKAGKNLVSHEVPMNKLETYLSHL